MTLDRKQMQRALKAFVVPRIRALGFSGRFPHFRRRGPDEHQLLMIFFNKYGGSLYVEAGRILDPELVAKKAFWESVGKVFDDSTLSVGDCPWNNRARLGPSGFLAGQDHWFVFGPENDAPGPYPVQPDETFDAIAQEIASLIDSHAEGYFA